MMTISEVKNFYQFNRKEYLVKNNKVFLEWYSKQIKKGYISHLDINEMQLLINKIVNWYTLKVPSSNFNNHVNFTNAENPVNKTLLQQLEPKLNTNEIKTLAGRYRNDLEDNSFSNRSLDIKIRQFDSKSWELKEHIIKVANNGMVKRVIGSGLESFLGNFPKDITIRELLVLFQNENTNFDYSQLVECIKRNDVDLDLRVYLFNMVSLSLLYSKRDTLKNELYKAKLFISNVNKDYNLNLSSEYLDKIISLDYSNEMIKTQVKQLTNDHIFNNNLDNQEDILQKTMILKANQ